MASEILSYRQVSLSLKNITSIVSSALELTLPPHGGLYDYTPKLPDGFSDWKYFDCIAIGHFDEDGQCPVDEHGRYPSGRDVQVRRVSQYDGYGWFYDIVIDDPDAKDGRGVRTEGQTSVCRSSGTHLNYNLFVMRGCLEYLRTWLDPSLPPRVAFLDSAPSMSLEGELYEIVNSRHEIRGTNAKLIYTCNTHDFFRQLKFISKFSIR
jgi:hypothetical protein